MNSLLPSAWAVPKIFRTRLGEQAGRQRTMSAEGHLLLILHDLPKGGETERAPIFFWREPAGTIRSTGSGSGLADLEAYLQAIEREVDAMETLMQQQPSADNYFAILRRSTPLLRLVRNAHRVIQEARELAPDDRHILLSRDRIGEQERALELLNSDAKNGLEYMIAMRTEEQARNSERIVASSYRLNLLIAVFLPLTALGSAFGMNLRHGLEGVQNPFLFWFVLFCGLIIGFFVKGSITAAQPAERKAIQAVKRK
jgi:hypothetical protein